MRDIRKIESIMCKCFWGGVFLLQIIGWSIVDYMGKYDNSIWSIIGIAALNTVITCIVYLFFHKAYQGLQSNEEKEMEEFFYEMFETD